MNDTSKTPTHRPVRSYVLRGGRLTAGQQRALDDLFPLWGVPSGDLALDLAQVFDRSADTILEIGFGNGESTLFMAQNEPRQNFLAAEVHAPGVGRLLMGVEKENLANVRVYLGDAVLLLQNQIPDSSLAGVRIYFPDPWHKKRHNKRRLIQADFVRQLATKLRTGGLLHLATDWVPYAEHMLEVVNAEPTLENLAPDDEFCARPEWRPQTKYERRGDRLGHETRDLIFRRLP